MRCLRCRKRLRRNTHPGPLWVGVHLPWFVGQHCPEGMAPNLDHEPEEIAA